MFKIIVPTDFSQNAENALNFAVEIANRNGGYIQLYHVYNVPTSTGSFISVEKFIKEDCENEMTKLLQKTKSKTKPKVIVDYTIISGSTISMVCNKADKDNYDLIVMGTKGASGVKGKLFGSNAMGIINRTTTPVLAIPEEAEYAAFNEIVLAVDDNPISDKKVIEVLKLIKDQFNASLTIFHLLLSPDREKGIHSSVLRNIEHEKIESTNHTFDKTIHAKIDKYALKHNANLLCMIRRKRGLWEKFLNPSVTKKEMGNSSIPLMILHD